MSGHSKWSTIKRQKGANDAKRGALFTKLGKEITIAARQGGGDPETNYRLRLAVDKARAANMPTDNIKRAIERATGGDKAIEYEEIVYEGYGLGGVALLVETATDNRNRTAAEVRSIFSKAGGQLAGQGSVAWQFEQRGLISVERGLGDPDDIALAAIDAGAVDVDTDSDPIEIATEPTQLQSVQAAVEAAGVKVESSELTMVATTPIEVDVDKARQNLRLIEALEDSDDVQRVTANFELPDEIMAEAAAS
ncbi:MAG: YebC/PmpR family DNA-binding transcriptional regulator [Chloroflexota bacterium]|jgi:YebC/PmpR family DNA-binding regulatory protein